MHLPAAAAEKPHHHAQQQQQLLLQQPFQQLFAALGLPANFRYSSYLTFEEDSILVGLLVAALVYTLDASIFLRRGMTIGHMAAADGTPVTDIRAALTAAAAAAAATSASLADSQQQQQQQGQNRAPFMDYFGYELPHEFQIPRPHRVQPLVLTLLQLAADLKPQLNIILRCFHLVDALLSSCLDSSFLIQQSESCGKRRWLHCQTV
jgi:hypothetical protein